MDARKAINASHGLLSALETVRTRANEAIREKAITDELYRSVMLNVRDMYGAIKSHALYHESVYQRQGGNFFTS